MLVIKFKLYVIKCLLIVANFTAGFDIVSVSLAMLHVLLMPMQKHLATSYLNHSVVTESPTLCFHCEQLDFGREISYANYYMMTSGNF